jgi:U3 small nucleolar RNA-associated protein 13
VNYLSLRDYRKAISLALAMEQPGRLLAMFRDLRSATPGDDSPPTSSVTGHPAVDEVIRTLAGSELTKLLGYLRDWNARAKTSTVAQDVLFAVVKLRSAEDVMAAFGEANPETFFDEDSPEQPVKNAGNTALKEILDGLIPYSERHLSRMERLVQESYVVDYLLSEMDTLLGDADDAMQVDGA